MAFAGQLGRMSRTRRRRRLRHSAARATESAATEAARADAAARAAVRGEDADLEADIQRLQVQIALSEESLTVSCNRC